MFEFAPSLQESCHTLPEDDDFVIIFAARSTVIDSRTSLFPLWKDVRDFLEQDRSMIFCGNFSDRRCFAVECEKVPDFFSEFPIRQFLFEYPENFQKAICRAKGLLSWLKQHRYCGCCREKLEPSSTDSGLQCPVCHAVYYPQLAPAVIVGITRNEGRELLLAHNRNFSGNIYSLIAGFVEAGESVEAAIHREIFEECGIRVKNLRYVTSQMWPFPNSLMLAFQAEYDSGNAEADGVELSDLGWFTADDHPELPSPGSVAREVIDRIFNQ